MVQKQIKQLTEYVKVLLASNEIRPWWGRLAYVSSWILLQGFVIFPSMFTTFHVANRIETLPDGSPGNSFTGNFKAEIFKLLRHVPLYVIAWAPVFIGGIGMLGCLIRGRRNYVWVIKEVIIPGIYASSTGLVSTVANIWESPDGFKHMSASSKLTLIVTGSATVLFFILWVLYKLVLLENAKKKHIEEAGYVGVDQSGEGCVLQENEMVGGKPRINSPPGMELCSSGFENVLNTGPFSM